MYSTIINNLIKLLLATYLFMSTNFGGFFMMGNLYCNTYEGCRHEIAHKMDYELGHPSKSQEFSHLVTLYLIVELKKDTPSELSIKVVDFLTTYKNKFPAMGSNMEELYAYMYEWVDGDISKLPDSFQPYYNSNYSTLYNCLTTGDAVKVCGRSIYLMK